MALTGKRVVTRIITDLAVIDVTGEGVVLREVAPGRTVDQVLDATGVWLLVPTTPTTIPALP